MKSQVSVRHILLISLMACEARPPIPLCPLQYDLVISIRLERGGRCGLPEARLVGVSSGGAGNNLYQINNGPFQESPVFDGIRPGVHVIAVTDKNYCKVTASTSIPSGISFKDSVKSIIEAKCSQSGCHDGTSISFLVFENVKSRASEIKGMSVARVMPKPGSPPLTEDEIEKITCWVDDGALNN